MADKELTPIPRRGQARNVTQRKADLTRAELRNHNCQDAFEAHEVHETWSEYDAQGIFLCRVCELCREVKLAGYRPEILSGYTQDDVDEPIEPEEY